ncbi:uncharacterized protein LOC112490424 isoform X1 [Ziziphus jujuba]|uniref:Uncharacterized protein LOC112490424 isoform X1 n=1 Tax=Ziziphus jujuba TaxID=326968 RepID=A0ABM3IC14_ZIZJJ|nr:uncharacterized protein LOC112490424 isoform X1 [Ziziphus jujuba]XP_048325339.2 uncharacterized protein LOC112490424 isoform X1 [Ziziphus jujuba]
MSTSTSRFLFSNGVVLHSSDTPPVTTFLEAHPGAYTTTRSHGNASYLLFWERHLKRLCQSIRILSNSNPQLLFGPRKFSHPFPSLPTNSLTWESSIRDMVHDSLSKVLEIALKERSNGEELSVTAIVTGNSEKLSENENFDEEQVSKFLDVHIHIGVYVPPVFGIGGKGELLAMVGREREVASAKHSDWVRKRKPLENLRPPSATELLLSNDGDHILEGSLSNFYVVCRKNKFEADGKCLDDHESIHCFEVQTAPLSNSVLPGTIRQLIIEVCLSKGIPVREVAPLWSDREIWEEAFISNSLRLLQHVETICAPSSWDSLHLKSWKEISWNHKHFKKGPGTITTMIQKEVMERAALEGYSISNFI